MKKYFGVIIGSIILVISLSSCSLNKIIVSPKKIDKLDKVAAINTTSEFVPASGLIYGSILNSKVTSISGELNKLFNEYTTLYRDSLGIYLSQNTNCKVIYGESLQNVPGFASLKNKLNSPFGLMSSNEPFFKVFISSGDMNPFKSLDPFRFIKPNVSLLANEKKNIQELCKTLDVNYVVFSYIQMVAMQGNATMRGSIILITNLTLFDKDGDYIVWGNRTGGGKLSPSKIETYPEILNSYFKTTKPMIAEIFKKFPSN